MTSAAPQKGQVGRPAPGAAFGRSPSGIAVLALLGAWSIAVPYLGRALGLKLDVARTVEVVDHVVPGLVVIAFSAAVLLLVRQDRAGGLLSLSAACMICLAGLWITATHVPLVADAARGRVSWGTALFHTASGPVILALALWLVVLELREPEPPRGEVGPGAR